MQMAICIFSGYIEIGESAAQWALGPSGSPSPQIELPLASKVATESKDPRLTGAHLALEQRPQMAAK